MPDHLLKHPSNDWCLSIGNHEYADVFYNPFSPRGEQWTALLRGLLVGRFSTKRRAKKAIKKEL